MWGVILALQSSGAVHLGVDNLGVVRHVGQLLAGRRSSVPFELVHDGDLLLLIDRMLHLHGLDTVRITKVKGHADEVWFSMVGCGRLIGLVIILLMRLLILGVGGLVILSSMRDVICLGFVVCWYPVSLDLHRFFIAISRAVVDHDGNDGTVHDPLVCWCSSQEASFGACCS